MADEGKAGKGKAPSPKKGYYGPLSITCPDGSKTLKANFGVCGTYDLGGATSGVVSCVLNHPNGTAVLQPYQITTLMPSSGKWRVGFTLVPDTPSGTYASLVVSLECTGGLLGTQSVSKLMISASSGTEDCSTACA
jgi:hypothetical protein